MTQKKDIKLVNPKWLLRQILKSLPAEARVRSTVAALWTFCNDFIAEENIAHGTVSFSGTVSYSQLAALLAIGESTAKWRMIQLRDKYELVEWERTKVGIKFTFGVYLSLDGERRTAERGGSSSAATQLHRCLAREVPYAVDSCPKRLRAQDRAHLDRPSPHYAEVFGLRNNPP